jgi:CPA2 family monovalent cation:H+ antiporter-2
METDPLVTMLVGGLGAAFGLGFVAGKLRLPLIAAYMLAGVLTGPYVFPESADPELVRELSDLGLILLMFGLGLRFPAPQPGRFRWRALPGALIQIGVAAALGYGVGLALGLGGRDPVILGLALSLSSAYALLTMLEKKGEMALPSGQILTSWLGVQAAIAMLALVGIAALFRLGANDAAWFSAVGQKAALLAGFVLVMVILARRVLAGLFVFIARSRSREVFSLGVFSAALGIAYAAYVLFGAGFALGALLAGLALNQAELSRRAGDDLIPFRDAFAVLFFVTLGMMLDPRIFTGQGWAVAACLAVIILGNGAAAFLGASAMRLPMEQRLVLAGSLAQIGEFSILIAGAGVALELISAKVFALIVACAVVTLSLNPLIRIIVRVVTRRYV